MNQIRRPLVAALLAFLAGLSYSLRFAPALTTVVLPYLLGLLLIGSRGARVIRLGAAGERAALLTLFALTGAVVGSVGRTEADHDCRAFLADGVVLEVEGRLAAAHRPGAAGAGAPLLPLVQTRLDGTGASCTGEFRVRMPVGQTALPPGSTLDVRGEWRRFAPPGGPNHWPRDPRFHGFLRADTVTLLPEAEGREGVSGAALAARARADRTLGRLFPDHQPLVEALLLGRREYVDPLVRTRFANAGLSHLLAISGMHVGLLAASFLLLAAAARLSRNRAILFTLAATWVYLLVIGAPASALRAGSMITLALLASVLQRPSAAGPIIASAAFLILGLRPMALLEPGFQLSFLGVAGILALRKPLLAMAPAAVHRRKPLRALAESLAVGIAAFIATAPVVAHHFGIVAPISILAGLPAVPLMSLALIGASSAFAFDPFFAPIATHLAAGAGLALDLLDALAAAASAVPTGHSTVPKPPWWSWGAASAAGAFVVHAGPFRTRRIRRVAGAGTALVVLVVWPLGVRATTDGLEIHFIDVGQGDAIAFRTPRSRWVLIDAGPASAEYDAGERRVIPFLRDRGARRIEALVLTHPDLDHIGGAGAILRNLAVRHVFDPGAPTGRAPYLELLRTIESGDTDWRAARAGRTLDLDGVRFEFLWPEPETVDAVEDANQISSVVRVVYGDFSILFTGDVGVEVESLLVQTHGDRLRSDVLKLGHHGSATSTSPLFLDTVEPELAVVSAGRRNRYGHPAPSVIAEVRSRSIAIARTDRDGTVTLKVEPGGVAWRRQEW